MTLVWIEGFETHDTVAALNEKYERGIFTDVGGDIVLTTNSTIITGAVSPAALRLEDRAYIKTPRLVNPATEDGDPTTAPSYYGFNRYTVGFRFRVNNTGDADIDADAGSPATSAGHLVRFLTWVSGTVEEAALLIKVHLDYTAGTIAFEAYNPSAGTSHGVQSTDITMDAWHYIEIKMYQHASTGSIQIYSDESAILTLANKNTDPYGNTVLDRIQFMAPHQSAGTYEVDIDDIYITHDDTVGRNGFLGDVVVEGLRPDSTKTPDEQQWTDNAAAATHEEHIDDPADASGAHDDDGSFLYAATDNLKERYKPASLSISTGSILGVQQTDYVRLSAAGTRNIRSIYKDASSNETNKLDREISSTSYVPREEIYEYATGTTDFTTNDINSGQFGVETRP